MSGQRTPDVPPFCHSHHWTSRQTEAAGSDGGWRRRLRNCPAAALRNNGLAHNGHEPTLAVTFRLRFEEKAMSAIGNHDPARAPGHYAVTRPPRTSKYLRLPTRGRRGTGHQKCVHLAFALDLHRAPRLQPKRSLEQHRGGLGAVDRTRQAVRLHAPRGRRVEAARCAGLRRPKSSRQGGT